MRMLYAIVFSVCLLLAPLSAASAQPADCGSRALKNWKAAIDSGQAARVAGLYATGSSRDKVLFLPTASPYLVTNRKGIVGYFEGFLETEPKVTFTECETILLPGHGALFAGFYYFTKTKDCPDGRLLARFSFLIRRDGIIAHHHSSVLPVEKPCQTPPP